MSREFSDIYHLRDLVQDDGSSLGIIIVNSEINLGVSVVFLISSGRGFQIIRHFRVVFGLLPFFYFFL